MKQNFHDFYRMFGRDERFREQLRAMVLSKTPDRQDIPEEEYEACCVYRVYVFKKRHLRSRYQQVPEENIVKL